MIVSAWNQKMFKVALPPLCHTMFQFYVADGKLSYQYQRSADVFPRYRSTSQANHY